MITTWACIAIFMQLTSVQAFRSTVNVPVRAWTVASRGVETTSGVCRPHAMPRSSGSLFTRGCSFRCGNPQQGVRHRADLAIPQSASRRYPWAQHMSMAEGDGKAGGGDNTAALAAVAVAGLGALWYMSHLQLNPTEPITFVSLLEEIRAGPGLLGMSIQTFLDNTLAKVESMGPLGPLYFGLVYLTAEMLIIPALPFTAAAGYLFGVVGGTAIVLASATVAAGFAFLLGRTFLRRQVEGLLEDNPRFMAIDKAIGKEGFKIILLLRLSPIFPFALSNYFYGVTAVGFAEYMSGTMLGFFPGTLAYVYGGTVGKAFTDGGESLALPWYGYLGVAALVVFILKTVGDIATNAVEELEPGLRDSSEN